jgi:hypothetical protein
LRRRGGVQADNLASCYLTDSAVVVSAVHPARGPSSAVSAKRYN